MSIRYSLTTTVSCEWADCRRKSVTELITDRKDLISPGFLPKGWINIDGKIYCPKHWHYRPGTNIPEPIPWEDMNEYKN